jgi:UDP-N-acetylglucosamine--N-acetylmuramyl-(pentapeptide) pyrophosphoryl-undecaprenol N-acetylglucosamine transferase
VTFAGSPERVEARLVPEAGFAFDAYRVAGLPRRPSLGLARAVLADAVAPVAAAGILRRRRPDVVLGGGGYVAGPVVMAAGLLRLPAALMEADAHLGLANRLAAPFARRIFLAFPLSGREPPKYQVTGRPIPARSVAEVSKEDARRRFELPEEGPVLLVAGGSQGARALNEAAVHAFAGGGPAVLHLAGERDYESLRSRVSRPDYRLLPLVEDFGVALAASDLAVGRAGGSVWELAAAGLPAILVPYPHATGNHQAKNARYFAESGAALLVPESNLARVPDEAQRLLADRARLARMAEAMRALAKPRAAEQVAEELIALAAA